jgi:hypothetical protein
MRAMTLKYIEIRDMRRAAANQAGRIVIGRHYGVDIEAWIARRTDQVDIYRESSWYGAFRVPRKGLNSAQLSDVALAGVAAEFAWASVVRERRSGSNPQWAQWEFVIDHTETISPGDLYLTQRYTSGSEDALMEDVVRLATMLRGPLWFDLVAEARALIVASRRGISAIALLDEPTATRH